jgi:carbon storage regulator
MEQKEERPKEGWLVIKRKEGLSILIGEDIEVCITKVRGKEISVAIKAPGKKILRKEIFSAH